MSPADIQHVVTALMALSNVLENLGVPGLVALGFSGPALVLVTILVIDHLRAQRIAQSQEDFQAHTSKVLEAYRQDTLSIVREVSKHHAEAVQFYRNNVELVKNWERMADRLEFVIINNTKALEHLSTIVQHREK